MTSSYTNSKGTHAAYEDVLFHENDEIQTEKLIKTKDEPLSQVFNMWRTVTPMQVLESLWGYFQVPFLVFEIVTNWELMSIHRRTNHFLEGIQ